MLTFFVMLTMFSFHAKFSVDGYVEVLGAIDLLQCFCVDGVAADHFFLLFVILMILHLYRLNSTSLSVSQFCILSMSFCILSASASELMFQYRRQSLASRHAGYLVWEVINVTQEQKWNRALCSVGRLRWQQQWMTFYLQGPLLGSFGSSPVYCCVLCDGAAWLADGDEELCQMFW